MSADSPSPSWNDIDRLLQAALEQAPADRVAFVQKAAGDDRALRYRVLSLLQAASEPTSTFDNLVSEVAAGVVHTQQPTVLGPYRLQSVLGRGGMGTVYLAERDVGDAVQRVALKVVRPGFALNADPTTAARFRRERSVLAGLEHPHIARLLDGGETPDGIAYLAMEYVDGEPITTYCANHRLGLHDRLRLFLDIARAIDFAHRRLVVHRDIKPGNILVAQDAEGHPHPKLLDFGIAKLLSEEEEDAMPLTQTGWRMLTPEYAAPEQLLGTAITTATDVYALGIVLYELLVGRRPFEATTTQGLERAILETEPLRPSSSQTVTPDPRPRTAFPSRELRGDLDTICLKALRKEPERRYGSAAELANDLERYLQGLPIEARQATLRYRTSKFVRRHRVGVLASVAILLTLLVGLSTSLWQAREARAERDRATIEAQRSAQATTFLADLLDLGDPFSTEGPLPASVLADSGAARLARSVDMDPLLRAGLLVTIGEIYKGQGRYDRHAALTAEAVHQLRRTRADPLILSHALSSHANALLDLDRMDEAEPIVREAYALLVEAQANPEAIASVAYRLGLILRGQHKLDEGIVFMEEAVVVARRIQGIDGQPHPLLVNVLVAQFLILGDAGHFDDAIRVGEEAIRLADTILEPGSSAEQSARFNLAEMLLMAGRYAESERYFRQVLAVDRQKLSPDHPDHANTLSMLAILALLDGRYGEAIDLAARAEAVYLNVYGEAGSPTIESRITGALARFHQGEQTTAEQRLRAALSAPSTPMDARDRAQLNLVLGHVVRQRGRTQEGEALIAEAGRLQPPALQALTLDMLGIPHSGR